MQFFSSYSISVISVIKKHSLKLGVLISEARYGYQMIIGRGKNLW